MSFMNRIKGERDIITLCESFSADYNVSLKNNMEAIEGEEDKKPSSDDSFNPDDLFNTVDLPEESSIQSGPSFSAEDIDLTIEQKEEIKKKLTSVLDEIQDRESISEPALEMIVNEVANETAYLSEAEDANLEGPVEKQKYRVGLVEAIKKFINELLGVTIENEGEVPEDVAGLGDESEGAPEGPVSDEPVGGGEPIEGLEGDPEIPEGEGSTEVPTEDENEDDKPKNLQEGVCLECEQDDVVEVDPSDLIQVVDDNDPGITPLNEPLEGDDAPTGFAGEPGEVEAPLTDETPLTIGTFKQLLGQVLTEGDNGEKSFNDLWKNLSGNSIVLSKPNTKGEQKTTDPKSKAPDGTTYVSPKPITGGTTAPAPKATTKGKEQTASPTAKAPEGTQYTKPANLTGTNAPIAKKPVVPKEEAAKVVASVISESVSKDKAVSFLKEAAEAIKNAKKSMNS